MSSVMQDRQAAPADRRWLVLVVVAVAQLMVVLDATIVNIALPSAQHSLGFPNSDRQWVVTAYALAFGSLLLMGHRLGELRAAAAAPVPAPQPAAGAIPVAVASSSPVTTSASGPTATPTR
jgi:MFS family permease